MHNYKKVEPFLHFKRSMDALAYPKFAKKIGLTRLARDWNTTIPLPWKLLVEITKVCNNKCVNCSIWSSPNKQFLSLADYEKLFKENENLFWLSLTGGEPFTRPDIDKIAKLAVDNCPDVKLLSIPTNGFWVEKIVEKTKALMNTGLECHITISLDGPEGIHNQIRGMKDGWQRAVRTFHALKDLGVDVRYQSTLHAQNMDVFKEFYTRYAKDIGVLTFTQTSEVYYENSDIKALQGEEAAKMFDWLSENFQIREKHDHFEKMHLKIASKYLRKKDMMIPCTAGFSGAYIATDGNVYPCFSMPSWGNIKEKSFKDIWYSEMAAKERGKIKAKQCPKCWINCFSFQDMVTYPEKAIAKAYL